MIRLKENQSQIWYKLLHHSYRVIDGSSEQWSLPSGEKKGAVQSFTLHPCLQLSGERWEEVPHHSGGTWLVSNPKPYYSDDQGMRIFIAQLFEPPILEKPGIIWVAKSCLVREATQLDLKRLGIHRSFQ